MELEPEQPPGGESFQRGRTPETDPYHRLAMTLVCLVAAGLVIVGGLNLAVYWLKSRHDHTHLKVGRCCYLSIPLVAGLLMLVKSSALARRLEHLFED